MAEHRFKLRFEPKVFSIAPPKRWNQMSLKPRRERGAQAWMAEVVIVQQSGQIGRQRGKWPTGPHTNTQGPTPSAQDDGSGRADLLEIQRSLKPHLVPSGLDPQLPPTSPAGETIPPYVSRESV